MYQNAKTYFEVFHQLPIINFQQKDFQIFKENQVAVVMHSKRENPY